MNWIAKSLNRKFILGTTSGLAVSSLVFLLLYIPLYQSELSEERARAASQVNSLLQTSLENAMLKRDLPGLSDVVSKLGQQDEIVTVFITNPGGEIRFSSATQEVGKKLQSPYTEHTSTTLFMENSRGIEVLRSINPVHNKAQCNECHGPVTKNPINGILYVEYDAAPLRSKVQRTTLLLMSAGALIVILNLTGGWWFIRHYVVKPVNHLSDASRDLTKGNLSARVTMKGNDEFAQLGNSFNYMAAELQMKMQESEEQQQFLQSLVDAIPDGVRIIDTNHKVLLTNKAYRQQLGMTNESGVGQPCYQIAHKRDKPCPPTLVSCPLHEISKDGTSSKVLHRHYRTDGSEIHVEIYAAKMVARIRGEEQLLLVESIRDLDKEVKYSQEQRLSELGRLATAVAHEIYNPLASVKMALNATEQSLCEDGDCPEPIQNNLRLVDQEIIKCIEITNKLLKLGSLPSESLELVDINAALHETLTLLSWQAEEGGIEIQEQLDSQQLRTLATESEFRMVALNLAQNAFHAMPSGGTLRVSSRREKEKLIIEFKDTGEGIHDSDLPYIYDPFFSRRADHQKGTGLGLSISLAIIEKYQGTLQVQSRLTEGSTFTIILNNAEHELESQS